MQAQSNIPTSLEGSSVISALLTSPSPVMSDQASLEEHQRIKQFTSHHLFSATETNLPADVITAACHKHLLCNTEPDSPVTLVESLALHPEAVPDAFEEDDCLEGHATVPRFSEEELGRHQRADPAIGQVITLLELGEQVTPQLMAASPELKLMAKEWNRLELKNGILYRNRQCDSRPVCQLVLPHELRSAVLKSLHDDMGHLGIDRTLDLVRSRFYWPLSTSRPLDQWSWSVWIFCPWNLTATPKTSW
ncbi:uncharacterized protein LOC125301028 [Alosa alosa]|uniref:uncharacterized protein LOC125301028 n=1 Tax=Alosa alosa TaxID=278164 RepID=UPI0020150702|nr:uncharacterized protein LOC125301028 [Alosa alosa]